MESDLVRNILSKNFAALYTSLNYQQKLHKHDWLGLTFYENNQRIFPLTAPSNNIIKDQDKTYLLQVSYPIKSSNYLLGQLEVQINWQDEYLATRQRITQLELILLVSILLLVLLEYYWNKVIILDPIDHLAAASKQLSSGDFHFPLHYKYNDELGELASSFDFMRNRILDNNNKLLLSDSVFKNSRQGIIITNANNDIIDANPFSQRLTEYTFNELLQHNLKQFVSDTQHEENFYTNILQNVQKHDLWKGELWFIKKSGDKLFVACTINSVYSDTGQVLHHVVVFTDITHLKEYENELHSIAFHDPLTGLPNRFLLEDRIQQATSYAVRHETLVAICFLDLDGFKIINDQYGHNAGDQLLIEVARRLQNEMRDHDTASRLGGDEFVLLMLDLHTVIELEEILERVLKILAKPYQVAHTSVTITASIGVSLCPFDDSNPATLLHRADQAMYNAKQQGKNQYSFNTSNVINSAS